MSSFPTLEALGFHARRSNHRAFWAPIYLETIVGSGERLCIGVAAADDKSTIVRGAEGLERLACVYGEEANVFIYASQVALDATERRLREGIHSLPEWRGAMDGLMFGEVRAGAGESLDDVARTALIQCASLLQRPREKAEDSAGNVVPFAGADTTLRRLENLVRDTVSAVRPDLASSFGRLYRASDKARPTRIGFVGERFTANLGVLVPGRIEPLVNQAKARLWDLTQLKSGAMADLFPQADNMQFELLLHRVSEQDPQYTNRQLAQIAAAVLELEEEADKASIRCRPMYSAAAIADLLLAQEAA